MVPVRRGGEPEEVTRAILWLLSEEVSYTSGMFIDVAEADEPQNLIAS